ncbi:hypothetical protein AAF712_014920 [Marasmius tenuissimus]|uniref:Uncharacterized protein n=1 Tax=Marasmius tenuissimus TaxID=585030 RepID=A0ABR2ZBT5_9AGAR
MPPSPHNQRQPAGSAEEASTGSQTRSVRGMINCALLELRPTLLKLDESTGSLVASLKSAWSRNEPGTSGLSADTAVGTDKIKTILQLRVELGSFMRTTETVIDQIISVCDCALHAMEEGDVGYLVPSVDILWSKPTGEFFRTTNGSSLTTLREAIQYVHDEMMQLFGEVEGWISALQELSQTTRDLRRFIDVPNPTTPLALVPYNDTEEMRKVLTDRCTQTEDMVALTIIALQSFERRLKMVLEPTESRGEVTYIDARLVRLGLKKMKEVRQKLIPLKDQDRGVLSVEIPDPMPNSHE